MTREANKCPGTVKVLELGDDRNANRSCDKGSGTRRGLEREGHMGELVLPQVSFLVQVGASPTRMHNDSYIWEPNVKVIPKSLGLSSPGKNRK